MITLGAKGGRATRDKHPDHLKEIAAAGGRATKDKPKTKSFRGEATPNALRTPEPEGRLVESPALIDPLQESAMGKFTETYDAGLIDVDAFLSSFQVKANG